MVVHSKIQKWGNSLALRLTGPVKLIPNFEADMEVDIEIREDGITIYPCLKHKKLLSFTEEDLLEGLDSNNAHADAITVLSDKEIGE